MKEQRSPLCCKERLESGEKVWYLSSVLRDLVKIDHLQNVGESMPAAGIAQAKEVWSYVVQMIHTIHYTCAEGLLVRQGRECQMSVNQGGFCCHAKEMGHYSAYDREVLKPEAALIKSSVWVQVCISEPFKLWEGWLLRRSGMSAGRETS